MNPSLADDYASCLRLARSHYENFPVASWLLPSNLRPHVGAVYAFARVADDFADEEVHRTLRLKKLRAWRHGLEDLLRPRLRRGVPHPPSPMIRTDGFGGQAPCPLPMGEGILRAVAASVRDGFVPKAELLRLLDAFEHDARERGYADMKGLGAYCRNSACSIGRILLHLFRVKDPEALEASDSLCTALQLTNFWQDFSRDLPRGRNTIPRQEARRWNLKTGLSSIQPQEKFQGLLSYLIQETRAFYSRSKNFSLLVPPGLARQIRLTQAGGELILNRVEKLGADILRRRPSLGWFDAPRLLLSVLV